MRITWTWIKRLGVLVAAVAGFPIRVEETAPIEEREEEPVEE